MLPPPLPVYGAAWSKPHSVCARKHRPPPLSHTRARTQRCARANSSHVGGERSGNMSGGARASKQQMQPRTLAPNNQIIKTHPNTLKNPSVTSAW